MYRDLNILINLIFLLCGRCRLSSIHNTFLYPSYPSPNEKSRERHCNYDRKYYVFGDLPNAEKDERFEALGNVDKS